MSSEAEWSAKFALLRQKVAAQRTLYAEILELVADIGHGGDHVAAGYSRLDALLVELLRVPVREARQLVAHAAAITPSVTLTGHSQPAELPATADAARAGLLSAEHLQVIATTMDSVPDSVSDDEKARAEAELVKHATAMPPHTLSKVAKHLLDCLDPDGAMPSEDELAQPGNVFGYHRTRTGRMKFKGELDTEAAEELEALLTSKALPTDTSDTRTSRQRDGDALAELIHLAASTPDLPGRNTTVPIVIVTIDHHTLTTETGAALLDGGNHLPVAAARRIACDAEIIPAVLGTRSVVLDQGRKRRLVTREQRIALITRDGGCAFPNCDRPPRFCDAHHVKHWADGGPTDLDNLVLLCRRHHRILHHSAWEVQMVNGVPEFTRPRWLHYRNVA